MMNTQRKYRCRKCGVEVLAGPYIAPELCSACQLAANAKRPESTSEITPEMIYRVAELHRTIKEQAAENAELRAEVSRLRDWMQRVTDAVLDWRTKVTGNAGSGCPIDAVVVLSARLRKSEAEIERLRALLAGYEAMEKYMKHEAMK